MTFPSPFTHSTLGIYSCRRSLFSMIIAIARLLRDRQSRAQGRIYLATCPNSLCGSGFLALCTLRAGHWPMKAIIGGSCTPPIVMRVVNQATSIIMQRTANGMVRPCSCPACS